MRHTPHDRGGVTLDRTESPSAQLWPVPSIAIAAAIAIGIGRRGSLRTFTRDRVVHATLGLLLGTFVYSLTVLRTVRAGGDDDRDAFGSRRC